MMSGHWDPIELIIPLKNLDWIDHIIVNLRIYKMIFGGPVIGVVCKENQIKSHGHDPIV